jgi:hypothetical protein
MHRQIEPESLEAALKPSIGFKAKTNGGVQPEEYTHKPNVGVKIR